MPRLAETKLRSQAVPWNACSKAVCTHFSRTTVKFSRLAQQLVPGMGYNAFNALTGEHNASMPTLPKRVQTCARVAEILLFQVPQLVPCQFKERGVGCIC